MCSSGKTQSPLSTGKGAKDDSSNSLAKTQPSSSSVKSKCAKDDSSGSFTNPKLYKETNSPQRGVIAGLIPELLKRLNWRSNDIFLDIGTGTGDALIDFILPLLEEKNFSQLIGTDISTEMIKYAQKEYRKVPNVAFEILDIGKDIQRQSLKFSQQPEHVGVDHIISFFCLHWVKNQEQAFENIYNLLKPGGDCLLMFLSHSNFFTGFERMKNRKQWAKYMPNDISDIIPPYQHSENPIADVEKILKQFKFSNYTVEDRKIFYQFSGLDGMKKFHEGVTPFFDKIPDDKKDAYISEYTKEVTDLDDEQFKSKNQNRLYHFIFVIYAKK